MRCIEEGMRNCFTITTVSSLKVAQLNAQCGIVSESCLTLVTPWTVSYQAPLSMGFSRQEYWSGLPFPSPGDLPNPGIEPGSPALRADALPSEPPGKTLRSKNNNQILKDFKRKGRLCFRQYVDIDMYKHI